MKAREIINTMGNWAREDLIDSWDNTGFQIGDLNKNIKRALIALDLDQMVLDMAIEENFDMIITHHPLIFKPLKSITSEKYKGNLILEIIRNDIVVYNAHSNLDLAEDGVNDQLARLFGLKNPSILGKNKKQLRDENSQELKLYGYGRVGDIEGISLEKLISRVKTVLDVEDLLLYGDFKKTIRRLALCGGSGSDFIYDAYKNRADLYITGDIKYHEAQEAHELGLTILDPGHFNTEKIILPVIKKYLDSQLKGEIETKLVMESGLPRRII